MHDDGIDTDRWVFPVTTVRNGVPALRGEAFPVSVSGGFLTCRHVVDIADEHGVTVPTWVVDIGLPGHPLVPVLEPVFPTDPELDLAYLPRAIDRAIDPLPLVVEDRPMMGVEVYSLGHLRVDGGTMEVHNFSGRVVASQVGGHPRSRLTLPYPVVEGLSGAAVMSEHAVEVVGICFGSESRRVLAAEVIEAQDGDAHYRETVNRIVEFGLAYRSTTIRRSLDSIDVR